MNLIYNIERYWEWDNFEKIMSITIEWIIIAWPSNLQMTTCKL